jgi:hypothetical protein
MEQLLEALINAKPNENGHYLPSLIDLFEEALRKQIERDAVMDNIIQVDSKNAGRLLFIIWKNARHLTEFTDKCPSLFLEEDQCSNYVDQHPDIMPLLAEVHSRKAYTWLCSNCM